MQERFVLPSIFEFQLPDEIKTLFNIQESIHHFMKPQQLQQLQYQLNHQNQQQLIQLQKQSGVQHYEQQQLQQQRLSPSSSPIPQRATSSSSQSTDTENQKNIRGWSAEEDMLLRQAVGRFPIGSIKWEVVAKNVPRRNMKQCRERWEFHLNPEINKEPFDQNEDRLIITQQKKLGNRWTIIAEQLPGRTSSSVKNRWYTVLKKLSSKEVTQILNYSNILAMPKLTRK